MCANNTREIIKGTAGVKHFFLCVSRIENKNDFLDDGDGNNDTMLRLC